MATFVNARTSRQPMGSGPQPRSSSLYVVDQLRLPDPCGNRADLV